MFLLVNHYESLISGNMSLKTKFLIVLVANFIGKVLMKSDFSFNEDLYEKVEGLVQSFQSYQIPLNNQEYFRNDTKKLPVSKYRNDRMYQRI